MMPQDLDYARIFDAEAPTVIANAQASPALTPEQIAAAQAELRAARAALEKIKSVALDSVRVSMDELRRTLLAANAARPQVNAGRVFTVGTAMRAR